MKEITIKKEEKKTLFKIGLIFWIIFFVLIGLGMYYFNSPYPFIFFLLISLCLFIDFINPNKKWYMEALISFKKDIINIKDYTNRKKKNFELSILPRDIKTLKIEINKEVSEYPNIINTEFRPHQTYNEWRYTISGYTESHKLYFNKLIISLKNYIKKELDFKKLDFITWVDENDIRKTLKFQKTWSGKLPVKEKDYNKITNVIRLFCRNNYNISPEFIISEVKRVRMGP